MIDIKINPDAAWRGQDEVDAYLRAIDYRKNNYTLNLNADVKDIAQELNDNGHVTIKNFFDKDLLLPIKEEFEQKKSRGELQYNDNYTEQLAHPLVSTIAVADIAFDDRLVDIASMFFGCVPTLNNAQLRKSKATVLAEDILQGNGKTTLFHCDKDGPRFIKMFLYLDDVDEDNGPFTYVHKSHLEKFDGWRSSYRRSHEEIENIYGKDRIKYLTGNVGDLIIANTKGFHKGKKVIKNERLLLTIYYNVHTTEWLPNHCSGRIKKDFFEQLPEHKKPVADYLEKI